MLQNKEMLSQLDDLCKRLQDDYAGTKPFKQKEEDRLLLANLCDCLENLDVEIEAEEK